MGRRSGRLSGTHPIGTETVLGEEIELGVNGAGRFMAEYPEGQEHIADTKAELIEKLKAAVKKAKTRAPIPVTILEYVYGRSRYGGMGDEVKGQYTHMTLRGVNSRTGTLLTTTEEGEKHTVDIHAPKVCPRLTPEQIAEYEALAEAVKAALLAYHTWVKAHTFEVSVWNETGTVKVRNAKQAAAQAVHETEAEV